MNNNATGFSDKTYVIDRFIFYFCLIDILFLPYFWIASIPYSMPIVICWLFARIKFVSQNKEFSLFKLILLLMFFSTVISFILYPSNIYKNATLLVELPMMFIYYFMFYYYVNRYKVNIKRILIVFMLFVTVFAFIYCFDKSLYQQIKYIWNPRMGTVWNTENFTGYRFGFFWMDENNIGYGSIAVATYLICNEKTSLFIKTALSFALVFIIVCCMSNGGLWSLIITFCLYVLVQTCRFIFGKIHFNTKIKTLNMLLFFVLIIILTFTVPKIPEFFNSSIAIESSGRIESNSGDSRITIWKNILKQTNFAEYIFLGTGGVTVVNDEKISPHNGHFFWILGYGIISYGIFMYMLFRKRKITPLYKYIFITPIFFGFTINILLGEIKFSAIFALLVAVSSAKLYLNNVEGVSEEVRLIE